MKRFSSVVDASVQTGLCCICISREQPAHCETANVAPKISANGLQHPTPQYYFPSDKRHQIPRRAAIPSLISSVSCQLCRAKQICGTNGRGTGDLLKQKGGGLFPWMKEVRRKKGKAEMQCDMVLLKRPTSLRSETAERQFYIRMGRAERTELQNFVLIRIAFTSLSGFLLSCVISCPIGARFMAVEVWPSYHKMAQNPLSWSLHILCRAVYSDINVSVETL